MPTELVDFVDAPTPFLIGLHPEVRSHTFVSTPAGLNASDLMIPHAHRLQQHTHCSQLQVDLEGRSTEHVVIVDLDRCELEG